MPDRKPHVRVSQDLLLGYLREVGPQSLAEVALIADVSEATARRKLDGLVVQGKLTAERVAGLGRVYSPTGGDDA